MVLPRLRLWVLQIWFQNNHHGGQVQKLHQALQHLDGIGLNLFHRQVLRPQISLRQAHQRQHQLRQHHNHNKVQNVPHKENKAHHGSRAHMTSHFLESQMLSVLPQFATV